VVVEQEIIGFTPDGQKIITTDTNNHLRISLLKDGKEDKSLLKLPHINYNRNYPPHLTGTALK
jgi:hypothetical protein